MSLTVFTIGHSTRSLQEFVDCLQGHGVTLLVDIRTIPKSRRYPHFNTESLAVELASLGIEYRHVAQLGGLRKPLKDSINAYWQNDSFRGYADYMQTEAFDTAVGELCKWLAEKRTAIMCAEAVPWRCHRNLVSDAVLLLHAVEVRHIMSPTVAKAHAPNPAAKVKDENSSGGRAAVFYPADDLLLGAG